MLSLLVLGGWAFEKLLSAGVATLDGGLVPMFLVPPGQWVSIKGGLLHTSLVSQVSHQSAQSNQSLTIIRYRSELIVAGYLH